MVFITFLAAFVVSFLGSIPPATINLLVIQLGLEKKINIALRLSIGAALMEYPYAWIAVRFEKVITSSPYIIENFKLLSAVVVTVIGVLNLYAQSKPTSPLKKFSDSGFRRGVILGIFNPLAIPFWIGFTAYLESEHWIEIDSTIGLQAYLSGVMVGGFMILVMFAYLSYKVMSNFEQHPIIKKIPGYVLLILGGYAFVQYFFF